MSSNRNERTLGGRGEGGRVRKGIRANEGGGGAQNSGILSERTFWMSALNSALILAFFIYIINFDFFTNNIKDFNKLSLYVLRYFKGIFHDKSLVKTLMEYIIPRKLIGWNINFGTVYLELLNVHSWKHNWKNIKHSLRNQIFQEHMNSITTGIILPKQLQIHFFKFYSKDWLFLKISTKLHIESLQYHGIMLLRKFDACFEPPNLGRFLLEYFIPERLFWVNKTHSCILFNK